MRACRAFMAPLNLIYYSSHVHNTYLEAHQVDTCCTQGLAGIFRGSNIQIRTSAHIQVFMNFIAQ